MQHLFKLRTIWITAMAWLGLVTLNQITRGYPIVPPDMSPSGYWALHIFIGLMLGAILYAITRVLQIIYGSQK